MGPRFTRKSIRDIRAGFWGRRTDTIEASAEKAHANPLAWWWCPELVYMLMPLRVEAGIQPGLPGKGWSVLSGKAPSSSPSALRSIF